jgi:4-diphosphocytidyl-2-C-methyl-D-erythritol kinase
MPRLLARGKVNWSLDIQEKRADGYHEMDMLMSSVELADELTVENADGFSMTVAGSGVAPDEDNLVLRAARAFHSATGCRKGARFALVKRLPVGAGMGGGSADAAAALIGLDLLFKTALTTDTLAEIGLSVGADVPFMLTGGFARVGGIGEIIRPFPAPNPIPLVILQPCGPLATREVFAAFDALPRVTHPRTEAALTALQAGDLLALASVAGNVLQPVSEKARPQIAEAVAALSACGAVYAAMTGSGSAVFGAFGSGREAEAAFRTLKKRWRRCWLTQTAKENRNRDEEMTAYDVPAFCQLLW